jgi:hypothetical protein
MKNNYKSIVVLAMLLSMITLRSLAQLSGTVTVNSTQATGSGNYQTFTALAAALTASGVTGPLVVNVSNGPYVEQPSFGVISGVSATNTITINGNNCLITFTSSSSATPWTLNLNGADRMYWNNINVFGGGATYAWVCLLSNGADYNTFTSCTFSCQTQSTGTSCYPVVFSGINSGISYANSGNYDTFDGCTMLYGYYSVYMIGNTGTGTWQTNNTIKNCTIRDFHYMGLYIYYQKNALIKNNLVDRITRTTNYTTVVYCMYVYYNNGTVIDGNRITQIFDAQQTQTSCTMYGIYFSYNPVQGANLQWCKNNVICDIKSNAGVYGILSYYPDAYIVHNTISFDHAGSTATGTTYGIYGYGQPGWVYELRDNLISITRGGTGTKYGYYSAGVTGNSVINNNNYYINAPGGTNYYGYYSSAATSWAAYQAQGVEANSYTMNPVFASLPTNVIPTNTSFNNLGAGVGNFNDYQNNPRDGATPDIGAYEFLSINCAGSPSVTTLVTPTAAICPNNNVYLQLANYYSDLGISYAWATSTLSNVGPWTIIPGANQPTYTTPSLTASSFYAAILTCANGGGSVMAAGSISIAGTTFSTVPYYESFEGISGTNKLPNCSWLVPNLGGNALTYTASNTAGRMPRTGTKFASFYYNPGGTYSYYTNGIQMYTGVTYSASVWWMTEYYGYNNWQNLAIVIGPNQNTTSQFTVAATNGPAVSNVYKSLSGTFTVPSSGTYYCCIRAQVTTGSSAQYLSWDDLSITVPCQANSPTMTINSSAPSICSGDAVTLTAGGADTYTWSTGATSTVITENPIVSVPTTITYMAMGTNALSGCNSSISQTVLVNPKPTIMVYASSPTVCPGDATNLTAFGASTYTWNTGTQNSLITVNPTSASSFTVMGSNAYGCNSDAVQNIAVFSVPSVSVQSSATGPEMCVGEVQTLTANVVGGAVNYQWLASNSAAVMQGNPINISPTSTSIYTVTVINSNGCSSKATFVQNVGDCVGLKEISSSNGIKVYPNPTTGVFTLELNNTLSKTIEVLDLTGRVVSSNTNSANSIKLNINGLASGIYYVKVQTENSIDVIKVVKN